MKTLPRWWMAVLILSISFLAAPSARADDWPQWLGPKRDGVWRETGILDKFPKDGPKVVWRTPLNNGYAGPAVADDRVYVMDRVQPPPKEGEKPPTGNGPGTERVLCLNAADGKEIWKHEYEATYKISYPSGPRTTPLVQGGKVYTLGAVGDLLCLDAAKGTVIWSRSLPNDFKCKPPVWGWAASLLAEGDAIISLVGGEGSAVVAFNRDDGKELWRALTTDEVCYSPPVIAEGGGKRQLIVWLSDSLNGLDPKTGEKYWSVPYPANGKPQRPAVAIAMPRVVDDRLFVSAFYNGGLMLQLQKDRPEVKELWRGKASSIEKSEGLHALMATPVFSDGYIYGFCGLGELRCLKADTGERIWETYKATPGGEQGLFLNGFLIPQGDRFFIFNDQGELIIAKLTPKGYEEVDRARVIEPTYREPQTKRTVVWSHPAFADRSMFVRNDKEIIRVSLAGG